MKHKKKKKKVTATLQKLKMKTDKHHNVSHLCISTYIQKQGVVLVLIELRSRLGWIITQSLKKKRQCWLC